MSPEEEIIANLRIMADILFEDGEMDGGAIAHNLLVYWRNSETPEERSNLGHHTLHCLSGRGGSSGIFISDKIPDSEEKKGSSGSRQKKCTNLPSACLIKSPGSRG